jgi:purine catabolism regulator
MALSVREVAGLPELTLVVRTDAASLDRQVRWVAVSEHLDPTPWLEGGDLLLTTGMALVDDPELVSGYVDRLVGAEVAALGFGVGLTHQSVPAGLIAAAERAGLPLLEVPQPVPFVAVSKAVSRLLTSQEYAESAASFDSQRRIIRAALAKESAGSADIVAALARHVDGFCLLLDAQGQVVAARPTAAAARSGEFLAEVERLRPAGMLASSSNATADEQVVILPIGVRGTADGFLVVGSPRNLRPADQAVVNVAASLLSWRASGHRAVEGSEDGWRRLLLRSAVEHGVDDGLLADLGLVGLHPHSAVAVAWRGAGGRPAPDAVLGAVGRVPGVVACRQSSGELIALCPSDVDGRVAPDVRATADLDGVAAVGVSCALDLTDPANVRQAMDQAERAAALGIGLQEFGDAPTRGLTSLIDAGTTVAWAEGYLGDLLTTPEGPELMNTLRAWLDQHGQVDAAAQRLGIHRHTVRHRIRRAEAVLGRSLDDPAVRADLWFALDAVKPSVAID